MSYVNNDIALIWYYHLSIICKSLFLKVRMKKYYHFQKFHLSDIAIFFENIFFGM